MLISLMINSNFFSMTFLFYYILLNFTKSEKKTGESPVLFRSNISSCPYSAAFTANLNLNIIAL